MKAVWPPRARLNSSPLTRPPCVSLPRRSASFPAGFARGRRAPERPTRSACSTWAGRTRRRTV
ncbi:hypothetical protein Tanf_01870 [Tannerella forsythia]|nr:hypothetical protein Tanf_01870 [Tannerella forsythia]